jgi:hypothetical protein
MAERAKLRDIQWRYVQSVLVTVGNMTINWAGVERLLDELIAFYQHQATDLSREHPRSLSTKLDYLKLMQKDERGPEPLREFLRVTRIEAKRLGNERHEIIHGLLHRFGGRHSLHWRTQRVIYQGPYARVHHRVYHNDDLQRLSAEISNFSRSLSLNVWAITRGDNGVGPPGDIQNARRNLGLG